MVVARAAVLTLVRLACGRLMRVDAAILVVVVVLVRGNGGGEMRNRMHLPRGRGSREKDRDQSGEQRMPVLTDELHEAAVNWSGSIINRVRLLMMRPPACPLPLLRLRSLCAPASRCRSGRPKSSSSSIARLGKAPLMFAVSTTGPERGGKREARERVEAGWT